MNDNKKESACHFYKQYHIEEAAAKFDDFRPIMQNIHFENGYAYASDGHMVVKAKIEHIRNLTAEMINKLNGKNINWRVFQKLRTLDENSWISLITDKGILVETNSYLFSCSINYNFTDDKYPNCENVIDKIFDHEVNNIGVNIDNLKRLQKAFGSSKKYMVFRYSGDTSIINVESYELFQDDIDIHGYIMPLAID
jgi:hypothetical protein